jgi:hypothetical protein
MPEGNGDDKKVRGYKVKRNVRSKQYKKDKKQRDKKIKKTGGYTFPREEKTGKPRQNIRKIAQRSIDKTEKAKNEKQVKRAARRLSKGGTATSHTKRSGELGPQVVYKPKN